MDDIVVNPNRPSIDISVNGPKTPIVINMTPRTHTPNIHINPNRPQIHTEVHNNHPEIDISIHSGSGPHYDEYEGPYTVYPDPTDIQILETENKLMTQNVLAMPIPYFRTSNPSGGDTIYIGD